MSFHDLCKLLNLLNKYFRTFLAVFATRLLFVCKEVTVLNCRVMICIKLFVAEHNEDQIFSF